MAVDIREKTVGVTQLRTLATDSQQRISLNQLPNGLIPATIGRCDNPSFANCNVWIKDHIRASQPALDPFVAQALPEIIDPLTEFSLVSYRAILRTQGQPNDGRLEQLERFQSRPGQPDANGYTTIDDRLAPAIKFTRDGYVFRDWGHNQPDNWGILLQKIGKAIEMDWPVLGKNGTEPIPLGAILQEIVAYAVYLRTEKFICRSIWEHNKIPSSYSTRRIMLAGLDQIERVWPELETNSKINDYQLKTSRGQLQDSIGSLREKVLEQYPGDYTDSDHESAADLAQGVVANDLNDAELPAHERGEIMKRILELEQTYGCSRYKGDPYERGQAEAIWTMGKPIIARQFFLEAIKLYAAGRSIEASKALNNGLSRMEDILTIKERHGFVPELFKDCGEELSYQPNNNELAWTLGYIIEASAAGIIALSKSRQYDQKTA